MNHFSKLLVVLLATLLITSCASEKRAWYLQDAQNFTTEQILQNGQIRIKPLDRITVVVSSRNPELAKPFNSFSSYNSLGGNDMTTASNSTRNSLQIRTINADGNLDMPIIGKVMAKGKTRNELAEEIAQKILQGGYINDPSVNIEFADMKIAVIGEVAHPGYFDLTRDKVTIFDALALAGDLTIFGVRDDVAIIREKDGERSIIHMNLLSKDIFLSEGFYLQQNDVLYVKPNKYKAQSGEISQNRSFYVSIVSIAISVATLIVTATR